MRFCACTHECGKTLKKHTSALWKSKASAHLFLFLFLSLSPSCPPFISLCVCVCVSVCSSPAQSHTTPPNYRGHFQRKAEQAGGLRLSDATDGGVALVAAAAAGAAAAPGGGKAVGRDPSTPGLSILILCVNELDSLKASLDTWERGGVLQFADEVLLYFQGRNKRKEQFAAPYLKRGTITRLLGDGRLFPIGAAVNWLVGNASYPTVMFLEKDFQLIEPAQFVAPRLNDGLRMLASGEADVVRYRSRWHAGEPNYAEGMFKGREHVILQKQPNLYCSVHYWMPNDMLDQKPHTRYLWRCPTTTEYYCTKAKFCNWTNNPQMFFRSWYMKRFYDKVTAILKKKAPDNDLEFFMNWCVDGWVCRGTCAHDVLAPCRVVEGAPSSP